MGIDQLKIGRQAIQKRLRPGGQAGRGRAARARDAVFATVRDAGHTPVDLTGPTAEASHRYHYCKATARART